MKPVLVFMPDRIHPHALGEQLEEVVTAIVKQTYNNCGNTWDRFSVKIPNQ